MNGFLMDFVFVCWFLKGFEVSSGLSGIFCDIKLKKEIVEYQA